MSFRRFYLPLLFLCIIISSCRLAPVIKEVEKTVYVEKEKPVYVEIGTGETYKWKIDLSQFLIEKEQKQKLIIIVYLENTTLGILIMRKEFFRYLRIRNIAKRIK